MKPGDPDWEKPLVLEMLETAFTMSDKYKPDSTFGDQKWDFEVGDYVRCILEPGGKHMLKGDIAVVRNRRNPYGPPAFEPGAYWMPLLFVECLNYPERGGELTQECFERIPAEELATLKWD